VFHSPVAALVGRFMVVACTPFRIGERRHRCGEADCCVGALHCCHLKAALSTGGSVVYPVRGRARARGNWSSAHAPETWNQLGSLTRNRRPTGMDGKDRLVV